MSVSGSIAASTAARTAVGSSTPSSKALARSTSTGPGATLISATRAPDSDDCEPVTTAPTPQTA